MRFYKDKEHSDKSTAYMFIEEGIIMGIHGENPPLMKTRKKIVIEEARLLWQKLLNEGWLKTNKKFLDRFSIIEHHAGDNIKKQTPKDFQRLWQIAKHKLKRKNS